MTARGASFDELLYDVVRRAVREELDQVLVEVRAMVAEAQQPDPKSISIRAAATRHGVSERTIRRLIGAGEIRTLRVGTRHVIPVDVLDEHFRAERPAS